MVIGVALFMVGAAMVGLAGAVTFVILTVTGKVRSSLKASSERAGVSRRSGGIFPGSSVTWVTPSASTQT